MRSGYHSWELPPKTLALSFNEVHVWRAALEQPVSVIQKLYQLLSPDEEERAVHFHFECDRRRFIVARGVLRTILGRYLGMEPNRLKFRYGPYGKPYLSEVTNDRGLRFNLAHSNELVVYGVACTREVGIDIEYQRPLRDFEEIAARFFSERENSKLRNLPKHLKVAEFFTCWTRKEAYIKALGEGLAQGLGSMPILQPREPVRLPNGCKPPQRATHWSLETLSASSGYIVALAVEGSDWNLESWQFVV